MQKAHPFLHALIVFLAIVSTTVGLSILTVRHQLLDAQMYKDATAQSGIYSTVDTIAQAKVTDVLVTVGNGLIDTIEGKVTENSDPTTLDGTITTFQGGDINRTEITRQSTDIGEILANNLTAFVFSGLRTMVDTQSSKLVEQGFENIQFEQMIQTQTEEGIDRDIAWLKGEGEAGEFFNYIPTQRQVEQVRDSSFTEIVSELLGINPAEKTEAVANDPESGEVKALAATVATEVIEGAATGIDVVVEKTAERTGLDQIFDEILDVAKDLAIFKQQALQFRQWVQSTEEIAYGMLLVGAVMTILAVFMTKTRRIKALFKISLTTGIAMIVLAFMHYFMISNLIVLKLSIHTMPFFTDFLSPGQNAALLGNISDIVSYILHEAVTIMFWAGMAISAVSAFFLAIEWFFHRRKENKAEVEQMEFDFEDDDSDTDSDEDDTDGTDEKNAAEDVEPEPEEAAQEAASEKKKKKGRKSKKSKKSK